MRLDTALLIRNLGATNIRIYEFHEAAPYLADAVEDDETISFPLVDFFTGDVAHREATIAHFHGSECLRGCRYWKALEQEAERVLERRGMLTPGGEK